MKRARILVVEDQAIVARDIRNRLTRLGYEPVGQTDRAEDAITLATQLQPDLIIMDISLAGEMDGITAARHIRQQCSIPVVFLTAHTDDATMDSAKLTEPFGYIIKPFQDRELRSAIEMGLYRCRAERALRESERRFRLLFEHSIDAVLLTRPEGGILAANEEACRMFGRTEEDLRRLGREMIVDTTDPRLAAALEERARTGRFKGELTHLRADGTRFPAEISSAVYRDENGIEQASIILRDVTQRNAVEEALRRANERLVVSQAAAGAGMWDWDVQTGSIEWTQELFRLFGVDATKQSASFDAWRAVLHPDDRVAAEERLAQAVRDGSMLDSEYRVVGSGGQVRWINAIGRTVCDVSGKPVRMVGICIDITARKGTEEAMRLSEERYRLLFDTSPDALFLVGPGGRFLDANGVAVQRYGYTLDELRAMNPASLAAADLHVSAGARVAKAMQGATSFEWRHRARDGREFPVEISTHPIVLGGLQCTFADVRDISERKRTEEALQASERALRDAQAAARVGTYVFDIPGDTWTSTPVLDGIFGIDPEFPHTAEGWVRIIHPAESEDVRAYLSAIIERHERFDREYRIVRVSDQIERWVLGLGEIEYAPDGKPLRMIGTILDITERKQAELALRRAKENLQLTIDAVPSLIAQMDRDFRYVVANRSLERWFGISPDQARGLHVRDVIGEAAWQIVEPFAQRALAGESVSYEREITYKGGAKRWIHTTCVPDRDDLGAVRGYVVLVSDITGAKHAEATRRMQAAALEAAGSVFVICDPKAVIQWVNPAFTALSGFGLEEILGRDAMGYLVPEMPAEVIEALGTSIAAGAAWRGEIVVRTKAGQARTLDAAIAPVRDDAGVVIHLVVAGQDVTEQKRLESQLLRAQRLESVGRLSSGLAHDLNNILLPVLLAPAYLRTVVSDPAALDVLDTIEVSVRRGADIIKQLLTFGRGSEASRAPLCLCRTVGEMMRILGETFPRSMQLRCDLPPGVRMVSANATQVHQIIMNLCLNARDAMDGCGELMLRVEDVSLTPEQAVVLPEASPGRYHVLAIVDTGRGIQPEHLDSIFEPFFTTKEIGEGSGLGLSTTLGIVRGHKGFIQVRSEVGRGTEMRIHLPALESS